MRNRKAGWAGLLAIAALACASSQEAPPESGDETDVVETEGTCAREATVRVHVWNQSSTAVQLAFDSYRPPRIAEGFSRTVYHVPRVHLNYAVTIRIARGGLQVGPDPRILTEPVMCNDATLVIGGRPEYSFFYGDMIFSPSDLRTADSLRKAAEAEAEADSAAAEAGPVELKADSASAEAGEG
jgi:hypothetical protein